MNFYKLERKDYKKVSKEFRNTFIGGRLYLIFDAFRFLVILNIILSFILEVILEKESLNNVDPLWLMCIGALISYGLYFKNLKEYVKTKERD